MSRAAWPHAATRRVVGPHAGRRPLPPGSRSSSMLAGSSRIGAEDASPLSSGPALGADRRRVRGSGHSPASGPGNRPPRVAAALLQPGRGPDPAGADRPLAPLLRRGGTGQPPRHGGPAKRRQPDAEIRAGRPDGRAWRTGRMDGVSPPDRKSCPRRSAKFSISCGTSNWARRKPPRCWASRRAPSAAAGRTPATGCRNSAWASRRLVNHDRHR